MQPSQALWQRPITLLAQDSTTLAQGGGLNVHLSQASFSPGLGLTMSSFTECTWGGYSALTASSGNQNTYVDQNTGNTVIELKSPAGGWLFQSTSSANMPQTIYGYYVSDSANANLYASALLPTPITMNTSGQGVDLGPLKLNFLANSPF